VTIDSLTREAPAPPDIESDVEDTRLTVTPQWKLVWWRFKKHRIAVVSAVVLVLLYLVAAFADLVAPQDPNAINGSYRLAPPTTITFFDPDGEFTFWPGVNPLRLERDSNTLRLSYLPDTSIWYPIELIGRGPSYMLWGVVPMDLHFLRLGGQATDQTFFLLGTDRLGRDEF